MIKRPQQHRSNKTIFAQNMQGQQQKQVTAGEKAAQRGFKPLTPGQQAALRQGQTNPVVNSSVDVKIDEIIVNVFFDGTGNNMYNTNNPKKPSGSESYNNAYTNVAWMFTFIKKEAINTYIDGIGTTAGDNDSAFGLGLGNGATGVDKRVEKAFSEIIKSTKKAGHPNPTRVTLNVFGFSRGSAAARHFVRLANEKPQLFNGWNLRKGQVSVNFVGLFDTVSSYSPTDTTNPNFDNDVEELYLRFKEGHVQKVVHLVADDEFRLNFSSTNIGSAIQIDKGFEMRMPGAHSDIGGSYNVTEPDRDLELGDNITQWTTFVTNKGWFKFAQLKGATSEYTDKKNRLFGNRLVYNNFHCVPLAVMKNLSDKFTNIPFDKSIDKVGSPNADIQKIKSAYVPFALNNCTKAQSINAPTLVSIGGVEWARGIYNIYMHYSANYLYSGALMSAWNSFGNKTFPNEPRLGSNGLPYRKSIVG